ADFELSFAAHIVETHRSALIVDREAASRTARGVSARVAREQASRIAEQTAVIKQPTRTSLACGNRILPLRPDGHLQLDFRARPSLCFVSGPSRPSAAPSSPRASRLASRSGLSRREPWCCLWRRRGWRWPCRRPWPLASGMPGSDLYARRPSVSAPR